MIHFILGELFFDFDSDLDLFDVRVPFPHLLHISHQFFIKAVRMLLQDDLQLEHLPDVWQRFAQDFVPVGLKNVAEEYVKPPPPPRLCYRCLHALAWACQHGDEQMTDAVVGLKSMYTFGNKTEKCFLK